MQEIDGKTGCSSEMVSIMLFHTNYTVSLSFIMS